MSDRKIIQIIPANNWYALYKQDDAPDEWVPLVAWAVVKQNGDDFVVGLDACEYIDFCDETSNFLRYAHESERPTA